MQTRRSFFINTASMAFAAGAISTAPSIAFANAPIIGTQAPSFYRLKLGDYEITAFQTAP